MNIKAIKQKMPLVVLIYILVQPLIDVLTAVGQAGDWAVSVGVVLRGVFLVATFAYLLTQKRWRLPTAVIGGFLVLSGIFLALVGELNIMNITTVFKVFYLPVAVMFFYQFKNQLFSHKIYFYLLATYLTLLVIPALVGLNLVDPVNYDGKIWFRGLFSAGNDIAAILICLAPVVLGNLIKDKQWILLAATSILLVIAALLIGTKAMIVCLVAIAAYLLVVVGKKWQAKIKVGVGAGLMTVLVAGAVVLPFTPVYQNTLIALEYHGVNSPSDMLRPEIIDRVVLSERPTFTLRTAAVYAGADVGQKVFGLHSSEVDITIESDPLDIFFGVGILGMAVYIFWAIYFYRTVKWRRILPGNKFSLIMMMVLAVVVGHVLITPAVATILALNFCKEGGK